MNQTQEANPANEKSQKYAKIFSTILAIGISLLIILAKDHINQFKHFGYLGILLISFAGNATVLFPAPVLLTVAAMGVALNPFLVGIIASFGAALGESVGYFLGLGGSIIVEKNTHYQKAKVYINKYGYWAIAFLAAIPNPLFDLAGIMAGAAGITYSQFFLATWAGSSIKYTLTSLIGFGMLGP